MQSKKQLMSYLFKNNLTISTCESFTGGFIGNWITNFPGASQVYAGGFICYSNNFKHEIVKVNNQVIKKYGVVSRECAIELAKHTLELTKSDISISFTGNAGPSALENKSVGLAYVCIYSKTKSFVVEINQPNLTRVQFKQHALKILLEIFDEII